MLDLGLSSSDQRAFHRALVSHHEVRTTASLMDLEHRHLLDLGAITDGQVDVDADGETATRSLSMTIFDPSRRSTLDDVGAVMTRMIRVTRAIHVAEIDRWVGVPIFTGPITRADREDSAVTIEAMGKEVLANSPAWRSRSWARGLSRQGVLRAMMRELAGETRFDFPAVGPQAPKLAKELTLTRYSKPWQHALILSRSLSKQVFYDGRGVLRLRARPSKPAWAFEGGDGGSVISQPVQRPPDGEMFNTFEVLGSESAKPQPRGVAYLMTDDPESRESLGRNGVQRVLLQTRTDSDIAPESAGSGSGNWSSTIAASNADALMQAQDMRDDYLRSRVGTVEFEGLVIPHLEPLDRIEVDAGGVVAAPVLRRFTIPLGGATASYGYNARATRTRRRR